MLELIRVKNAHIIIETLSSVCCKQFSSCESFKQSVSVSRRCVSLWSKNCTNFGGFINALRHEVDTVLWKWDIAVNTDINDESTLPAFYCFPHLICHISTLSRARHDSCLPTYFANNSDVTFFSYTTSFLLILYLFL